MDDSRMDTAPSVHGARVNGWEPAASWVEPTERAHPLLMLTPVPRPRAPSAPWAGPAGTGGIAGVVVTGVAVLVITTELGRRAGAPARLTAVCSAGVCAAVIVPHLVPHLVPRFVPAVSPPRTRRWTAFAGAAL